MRLFWVVLELAGTLAALAVLVTAAVLEPDPSGYGTHTQLGLPPCEYLLRTGRPCVSCGLTTAYANMIRLRPVAAFHANPAGVVLFLVTLALPVWLVHSLRTRRDPFRFVSHRIGRWVLPGLVVAVVVSWMVRFV